MASAACVKNIGMSSEKFLDRSPTFGWLHSSGITYDNLFDLEEEEEGGGGESMKKNLKQSEMKKDIEVSRNDMGDFEFRLEDPVTMQPADELFSDGKLLPLRFGTIRTVDESMGNPIATDDEIQVPETEKSSSSILDREIGVESAADLYDLFSPKAPRCSSRLREILGLKRIQTSKQEVQKIVSVSSLPTTTNKNHSNNNHKYLKYFLSRNNHHHHHHKSSHSAGDSSSQHLPLLKEIDYECVSTSLSARLSLSSSSSSGFDHEDLPSRLSLDSEKLNNPIAISSSSLNRNPPKARAQQGKSRTVSKTSNPSPVSTTGGRTGRSSTRRGSTLDSDYSKRVSERGVSLDRDSSSNTDIQHQSTARVGRSPTRRPETNSDECTRIRAFSVDSPRMNSSGKVVFHNLGRSSSSPSSFGGGQPKIKPRGMERSYSSNVMVTPVLNVPVCSLRGSSKSGVSVFGFGQLFPITSSQRKDGSSIRDQIKRNRTDRVC